VVEKFDRAPPGGGPDPAVRTGGRATPHVLTLQLPFRAPFCPDNLFGHLAATAVPGCEEARNGAYRRTLRLPHGTGIVTLVPEADHVAGRLVLDDHRDVDTAVSRVRWLLDLDANPAPVMATLAADPLLAPGVRAAPGRRVPRTVDGDELALRMVLGQQVSTAAARTHAARIVAAHGRPVTDPEGGLTHLFPSAEDLIGLDPSTLALPRARRRCFAALVEALATGDLVLGLGADPVGARRRLAAVPGVGPWTIEMIAMRALGDADAFPASDMGVVRGAESLGIGAGTALKARAERWRPWRAYAVQYLWATQDHAINRWPTT
jgi:AraC family transcriptional regulator of adaptative response / DNA-3-methyladenine glycosylase II